MPRVLAFDVNETLLDLRALDPLFERAFGDPAVRGQWFAQMLQLAFVGAITGDYVDFSRAQRAALSMVAERGGRSLDPDTADEIADAMTHLPPHPEVAAALERLGQAGFPMVPLTNSPQAIAEAQIANAGLNEHFDAVLSADAVKRLKPAPEPYGLVAEHFGADMGEVRLIAAHAWDVAGAMSAGCRAAFVARPGMVASPLGEQPDISGADLGEVAEQILARDR